MPTIELTLPRLHPAQESVKQAAARYNVINCGRRWGKDVLCMDLAIEPALRGFPVAWYQPTYRGLSEVWRSLKTVLYNLSARTSEVEHRIELKTGGAVEMWSLQDPDSGRGRKYKRVVVNEAAMVRDLEYSWNNVIRPALADFKGDAFFPSTPKGLNYYHTLWSQAEQTEGWRRFRFPTSANPFIDRGEIEALRLALPERVYQQEIMAEFLADGAFFQNIDACATVTEPDTPEAHEGHALFMGVDWALSNDYTVIGVGCRDCVKVVDWLRFNQIDYTYQREKLYALWDRWTPQGCLPERNSIGEPNIEIIRERVRVLPGPDGAPGFNTTATTKPALIQALATALEHDGFQVPAEAADELRSYEVETMASGHPKFSAPTGVHDDWVMMLALLWRAMTSSPWFFSWGEE